MYLPIGVGQGRLNILLLPLAYFGIGQDLDGKTVDFGRVQGG